MSKAHFIIVSITITGKGTWKVKTIYIVQKVLTGFFFVFATRWLFHCKYQQEPPVLSWKNTIELIFIWCNILSVRIKVCCIITDQHCHSIPLFIDIKVLKMYIIWHYTHILINTVCIAVQLCLPCLSPQHYSLCWHLLSHPDQLTEAGMMTSDLNSPENGVTNEK